MSKEIEDLKFTINLLKEENQKLKEKIEKLEDLIFRLRNDIDFLSR